MLPIPGQSKKQQLEYEVRFLHVELGELRLQLKTLQTAKRVNGIMGLARTFLRLAAVTGWLFIVYLMVVALAGKNTNANFLVNFAVLLFANRWVFAILAGLGGVGWGWRERHLRHRKTEAMGGRIKELETMIDKGRTSSNLTKTGQTNPHDLD